jgi:hypothetical protein
MVQPGKRRGCTSTDGSCARLDDRRRFELIRDDEDGARCRRVARGRRPRLAPRRLEEVIDRGSGSVRWMGMAARGYGQQRCCQNGEGGRLRTSRVEISW